MIYIDFNASTFAHATIKYGNYFFEHNVKIIGLRIRESSFKFCQNGLKSRTFIFNFNSLLCKRCQQFNIGQMIFVLFANKGVVLLGK